MCILVTPRANPLYDLTLPLFCGVLSSRLMRPFCAVPRSSFFVQHWTEIAQARMKSAVILGGHTAHDDMLGLLLGGEALPVHTSCLQLTPDTFDRRVIPAIASRLMDERIPH